MTVSRSAHSRPVVEGGTSLQPAPGEHTRRARRDREAATPSYYDVPMLKPPVWTWEIAAYFFLGGLSAGAYLLARMAARFGRGRYPGVTRAGTSVAAAAFLPCAPLLIADLGDRTRFHYMLRLFKPKSPMNLGAWTLAGYGGALSLSAIEIWRKSRRNERGGSEQPLSSKLAEGAISTVSDGAGIPLALMLAGYTGVLLSTTATPVWARNRWIGPMFSAGALGTGASAIRLALSLQNAPDAEQEDRPLHRVEAAAHLAEAVAIGGFLASAGKLAKPVSSGKLAAPFWVGAVGAGLAIPALFANMPAGNKQTRRWLKITGAALSLAGGFALRWAITQAGHPSGSDPQAARDASKRT